MAIKRNRYCAMEMKGRRNIKLITDRTYEIRPVFKSLSQYRSKEWKMIETRK